MMSEPIYFSKVEFIETIRHGNLNSIILLNLLEQELSYQVFKPKYQPYVTNDSCEPEVIFSYGIKLTEQQMEKLLPLCNANDFEPFRDKEMRMGDKGYLGYRDEVQVRFRGITDSHIPLLELSMDYYYDDKHIYPSEKLYRHIITNIFDKQKKMKGWYTAYGGLSSL